MSNFDDNDLYNFPSSISNSRSGSMMKLAKRNNNSTQEKNIPKNNGGQNELESMLDEMLFQQKGNKFDGSTYNIYTKKTINSSVDDHEPSRGSPNHTQLDPVSRGLNMHKTATDFNNFNAFTPNDSHPATKTRVAFEPSTFRINDDMTPTVSTRNMKPPLRKREQEPCNQSVMTLPKDNTALQLNFKSENFNDNKEGESYVKLNSKRSSIQRKILQIQQHPSAFRNQQSLNQIKRPEQAQSYQDKFPYQPDHVLQTHHHINLPIINSNRNQEPQAKPSPELLLEHKQEIQRIKKSYESQLNFLQDSLEKHIHSSQKTQQQLIQQNTAMTQAQRQRSQKLHQSEVTRLNEIFQWQKNKMQESHQTEMNSLKTTLQFAMKNAKSGPTEHSQSSQRSREQLDRKRTVLEDKERMLNKRQAECEQTEQNILSRTRRQQDRLREEEKRIVDFELNAKARVLEEKRHIANEKEQMGLQLAQKEMELYRKKESLNLDLKQLEGDKEASHKERVEIERLNRTIMVQFKDKMSEIAAEKDRLAQLEMQLLRKIRTVEMKSKELSANINPQNKKLNSKQNSLMGKQNQKVTSINHKETAEIKKNLNETHERFLEIQRNYKRGHDNLREEKVNIGQYLTQLKAVRNSGSVSRLH